MEIIKIKNRRVHPIGNSFIVFLPIDYCRSLEIQKGDFVDITINEKGECIFSPHRLEELKKEREEESIEKKKEEGMKNE